MSERLHITKKTTPFVDLIELNEYKGVNIISPSIAIEEWKKFSKVDIDVAYRLLQIIIDNLHDDLAGYTLTLFYSGYTGFSVKEYRDSKYSVGFILFENNKYISELKGKGCYFSEALGNKVSKKLINFIGTINKEFNRNQFNYIIERLHITKNTKPNDEYYYFNKYFSEVPKNILDNIWKRYIKNWPLDKEAKDCASGVTAFEFLFYMAACLNEDNFSPAEYIKLGYKNYKGKNNPYDASFCFDDENDNGVDLLDFCKYWISKNFNEFTDIYELCKDYPESFNTDKINGFFENVYDIMNK